MSDLLDAAPDSKEALMLDPFGWRPQWASLIPGLGGDEPCPDPSYVFATMDSRPAIGRVCATVRFHNLVATRGTLLFEVRVRSAVPGSAHSRLKTVTIDAQELVAANGVVELGFESYRNAYYAIACGINDETDLAALHISVSIDRRATPDQHGREWEWSATSGVSASRRRNYAAALVGRSLTDLGTPRLEEPMSQVGSPLQCHEPAFAEAMKTLRRDPVGTFDNWSLAYVLRAISRFSGQERCRMLGYGVDEAPLLSYFAGRHCEVVGMRHVLDNEAPLDPGHELQRLWVPELCDEADFFVHAHLVTGDIRQTMPTLHDQFDVIWSIGVNREMTPGEFVYFVVNGMIHAKLGGLAVHVFDYVEEVEGDRGNSLTRHDIERIAALALSHNIEVARLQFQHGAASPDKGTRLPFGLVLLRGGALDG
jgi:hypothetical protein